MILLIQLNFNIPIQNDQQDNKTISQPQPQPSQNDNKADQLNQDDISVTNIIQKSANPLTSIFTILFKLASIVSFILLDFFTDNEAMAILIVILLGAIDFWVTKNISGRKLVGLRWWNQIKSNGEEVWRFESKNESK